jgi:hypothetical protein
MKNKEEIETFYNQFSIKQNNVGVNVRHLTILKKITINRQNSKSGKIMI